MNCYHHRGLFNGAIFWTFPRPVLIDAAFQLKAHFAACVKLYKVIGTSFQILYFFRNVFEIFSSVSQLAASFATCRKFAKHSTLQLFPRAGTVFVAAELLVLDDVLPEGPVLDPPLEFLGAAAVAWLQPGAQSKESRSCRSVE